MSFFFLSFFFGCMLERGREAKPMSNGQFVLYYLHPCYFYQLLQSNEAFSLQDLNQLLSVSKIVGVLNSLTGDLAGTYYPLSGMDEKTRQQLVDDHFLFKKGDRFLEAAGINKEWPEGRGIFHNNDKTFLVWVNEEDQLRIISMGERKRYWISVQQTFAVLSTRLINNLASSTQTLMGICRRVPPTLELE